MAIRTKIRWDPKKIPMLVFFNYSDVLSKLSDIVASGAFVFVLLGLWCHWKCPISPIATNQAQFRLLKAFVVKAKIGLKVWCLTSDATTFNLSSFRRLGCLLGFTYVCITTKHATLDHEVFCIFDPYSMLKLTQNTLASHCSIVCKNGEISGSFSNICMKYRKTMA